MSALTAPHRGAALVRRARIDPLRRRETISTSLFLVPIVLVFVLLFAVPLAQSFYFSLTDFDGYSVDSEFVGLANYASIVRDPAMLAGLLFTLTYSLGTTVLVTALAIPLALVLNRPFVGRGAVRAVLFFPAIPSIAILGLVWGLILSPLGSGAINRVLETVAGLGPVPWLSNGTLAQLSVIVVGVWSSTGWHAILYLAYLQSIPEDYYEVARIDGASAVRRFFSITLPLLAPAVTVSTLLLMTGGLKVYDLPFTLTKGGPGFSTYTITQSIIQNGVGQAQFGKASALAVVFLLVVGSIVAVQLLISRRFEERTS
ncbi:sugar ABC transporter permease [Rathayibacter caricis DSM 15933]|uniref:Sugar ABC transporter permease n=1 Tax=Rathayibacter caricis DSM 15933 TaxID=1328867 RepID=A0A2T4UWF8_9MICO|nr:sugar ABC transporter permease [Rathayibacter caricis]MCJ1694485.1 sugar ABC transporter permease [Rathayibacter caricis]PTL73869.1 sugar ABC transporter permease [Rathayibacter caricis DSM 15933]